MTIRQPRRPDLAAGPPSLVPTICSPLSVSITATMPMSGRVILPVAISSGTKRAMRLIGMAKPRPALCPDLVAMATFMPISRPLVSSSGPPELPGFRRRRSG